MNTFKLFDTQKIDFHSTRRSPYHFSPIKALNGIGDQTRYSPLLKKTNRTEMVAVAPKQRSESTDEKQYSSPKLNRIYRITKRNSNAPLKAADTHYGRAFPRTWENNSEIAHLGHTESNMRASPDSLRHRFTADGIHNNRTCPTIGHEDPLKLMKVAIAGIDEVIGKLGTEKEPDYFIYTVGKGNNDQIIKKVMQRRYWWRETYTSNNIFHFSWQPTSRGIHYDKLFTNKGMRQIVNHYEFHAEISTKINLIKNLQTYCEKTSSDIFDITPTTFIIDFEDPSFTYHMQEFVSFFQKYSKCPADRNSQIATTFPLASMRVQKNMLNISSYSSVKPSKPKMQDTLYNGCNLWLLKPTEFNRGRGINLFNKLASLEYYLKCFQVGEYAAKWKNSPPSAKLTKDKDGSMNLVKSTKFVVQKYLEKPMLIDNRKFDIRVWVLLDHQMNLYFFREGYIRLSSEPFSLNENQIEDKYVHLTNNAIQKNGKNYGKHESGNIIPLHQLRSYLPKDKAKSDYIRIVDRIKDIIKVSMKSGREKLNAKERRYCFEIFGFDFILDQQLNVWLIEINTNPCLEESNDLLKKLVPRMLDDAFKLTLDKLIIPTPKNFKPEDIKKAEACPPFSVIGYDNNENIWEHLANLKGVQIFCKLK